MSNPDPFVEGFKKLLREIPPNTSLQQWQFEYRQVISLMGLRILEQFPTETAGRAPSALGGGGMHTEALTIGGPPPPPPPPGNGWGPDSGGPGIHPSLVYVVLGIGSSK